PLLSMYADPPRRISRIRSKSSFTTPLLSPRPPGGCRSVLSPQFPPSRLADGLRSPVRCAGRLLQRRSLPAQHRSRSRRGNNLPHPQGVGRDGGSHIACRCSSPLYLLTLEQCLDLLDVAGACHVCPL